MEKVQAHKMRSVPTEVVCVWMIVYINGCICNIHLPMSKYSMCAQCILKWRSRYLTVYVGAQNGCSCACVHLFYLEMWSWTSSALAVARKELVEQLLKCRVLGHDIVFAQVVAAGGAGVHLRSKWPLQTSLVERESEVEAVNANTKRTKFRRAADLRTHLANVVRAHGGDGLERQLLAANAHEDLFHFA